MRPIKLILSGLNSFREEQSVDFARICDGSVFGIFGPTGSGKSTLIDAITLALYGKVERAQRGLQGIVNKGMDSASVCFEFELGSYDGLKIYRVERKYVAKDEGVTCRLARLTEIEGENETVLADKVSQVDAEVFKILGLTVDDFTRAVVLPQGKFAEFLSLRGVERREMLERIFGLRDYGERLLGAANSELKATQDSVRDLENQQKGLGEADKEALKRAEASLSAAMEETAASQVVLQEASTELERCREIVGLQEQRELASKALASLQEKEPHITSLEESLATLSQAEEVTGVVQEAKVNQERLQSADKRLEEAITTYSKLETSLAQQRQALKEVEEELEQQSPQWYKRRASAERALTLEDKMQQLLAEGKEKRKERDELDGQKQALTQKQQGEQEEDAQLKEKAVAMESLLNENRVQPKWRHSLEDALSSLQGYKQALGASQASQELAGRKQAQLDEASRKYEQAETGYLQAEKEFLALEDSLKAAREAAPAAVAEVEQQKASHYMVDFERLNSLHRGKEKLSTELSAIKVRSEGTAKTRDNLSQEAKVTASGLAELAEEQSRLENSLKATREASMAALLAAGLSTGDKCPVCGSLDHPEPGVQADDDAIPQLEALLSKNRAAQTGLLGKRAALLERTANLDKELQDSRGRLEALGVEVHDLDQQILRLLQKFPAEWVEAPFNPDALALKVHRHGEELQEQVRRRSDWQESQDLLKERLEVLQNNLASARQEHAVAATSRDSMHTELNEAVSRCDTDKQSLEHALAALKQAREELGVEDVEEASRQMRARDQLYQETEEELRKVQERREDLRRSLEGLSLQLVDVDRRLSTVEMDWKTLRTRYKELDSEIAALTEGTPAKELLTQLEGEEKALKEKLTATRQRFQKVEEDYRRASSEKDAASEAHKLSLERGQEADSRLEKALQEREFADLAAWSAVMDLLPQKEQWTAEVKAHRQEKTTKEHEVTSLATKLGERRVTTEQWEQVQATAADARGRREEALGKQGQAEATLGDVRHRNARYEELSRELKPLKRRQQLFAEIVSLLRGNALVEFIAAEHLDSIAAVATHWLRRLTRNRYALEVGADGGFVIRDEGSGGLRRPVHTLSGGETFVTSLALALALSSQIQLRGRYPLEFFFLDEGFGTLDPELLDVVMGCLERMQGQNMSVGIISHVPELRQRIQRKIVVTAAEGGVKGSRLALE